MKLTESMILNKSKAESLHDVRSLNMWGADLTDVQIFESMPNVEILSLSVNKIDTLRYFRNCRKLTELYLRKNEIESLDELQYIENLPSLKILWLCDNPCTSSEGYRVAIISRLPTLVKLDNIDVTAEERALARKMADAGTQQPQSQPQQLKPAIKQQARPTDFPIPDRIATPSKAAPHGTEFPISGGGTPVRSGQPPRPNEFAIGNGNTPVKSGGTPVKGWGETPTRREGDRRGGPTVSNAAKAVMLLLEDLDQTSLLAVRQHCDRLLALSQ